jgi:hypothetical protein
MNYRIVDGSAFRAAFVQVRQIEVGGYRFTIVRGQVEAEYMMVYSQSPYEVLKTRKKDNVMSFNNTSGVFMRVDEPIIIRPLKLFIPQQ